MASASLPPSVTSGRLVEEQSAPTTLLLPLHVRYIQALDQESSNVAGHVTSHKRDSLSYHLTTHLRLNGVYWGLTALEIMGKGEILARDEVVEFVMSCWDPISGGFGSFPSHDAHILSTLSAIQVLAMKEALDVLNKERVIAYILSLQLPTGAFTGDVWGEEDTRFMYCAVSALAHMNALDRLNKKRTVEHILRCRNFDGGFGTGVGAESHAAQGALSILDALDRIDIDQLGWWLAERQLPSGGLNGRPEKTEDVCYSWWVLSSLSMIGRLHWINGQKLAAFILSAQDPEIGGIADRPDNVTDVFHTNFGLAGLSLLGHPDLQPVDPVYCMPAALTQRLGMRRAFQVLGRRT